MPRSALAPEEPINRIFVKNLVLLASVGVYEHEKKSPQRIIINASLDIKPNVAARTGDIQDTVSYEIIIDIAKDVISHGHINLLEEIAEAIAERCLAYENVSHIHISIEKPDVFTAVDAVGVEISRSKD